MCFIVCFAQEEEAKRFIDRSKKRRMNVIRFGNHFTRFVHIDFLLLCHLIESVNFFSPFKELSDENFLLWDMRYVAAFTITWWKTLSLFKRHIFIIISLLSIFHVNVFRLINRHFSCFLVRNYQYDNSEAVEISQLEFILPLSIRFVINKWNLWWTAENINIEASTS
jgi:hypothetical protein